jgi:aryl-alcohol dehydrogenase-like predicted oxidoreductase
LLHQLARGQHHHWRYLAGQLDENIDAWGTQLSPEVLAQIDRIRWEMRDPAL